MNYVLLIFLKDLKKRPNRFQMFKKRLKNASFNLFNMSMWGFSCATRHIRGKISSQRQLLTLCLRDVDTSLISETAVSVGFVRDCIIRKSSVGK